MGKYLWAFVVMVMFILTSLWATAGLIVGVYCYRILGLQSRFVGWPLVLAAEVLFWQMGLLRYSLVLLMAINLALIALCSFYFQVKDEGTESQSTEQDILQIRFVFNQEGGLLMKLVGSWNRISVSIYTIYGGYGILMAPLIPGSLPETMVFGLCSMSAILVSIRFTGGMKGKLWSGIGEALKVKTGILPRPTLS